MSIRKKYKLEDIATDIAMGPFGSNLKVDNFVSHGVPVIRGQNLNENGFADDLFVFVSEQKAQSLKRCLAFPDDLVFTHRGTIGQVGIIPRNQYPYYLVSQSQMKLSVNKQLAVPRFLYYWFKSSIGQYELLKNSSQVGVPAIATPTKSLKEIDIEIPGLKEQDAIAEILSSLDAKIELNNQMNANLEALAQAIFKQWFIDFEFPDENGNPYKSSGGKMIESALGLIPADWRVSELQEILNVKGGGTPSTKESSYWDGDIYWTSPKDLSKIRFPVLLDTEKKITAKGLNKISSGLLPKGTLLMSSRAPIGYLAIAEIETAINQGYIAINCCHGYSNLFMLHWLSQNMDRVTAAANGSTFLEVNKANFKRIKLVVPDFSTHNRFIKAIESSFEMLISNEKETLKLKQLRDMLLPKLISGQINIEQKGYFADKHLIFWYIDSRSC